MVKMMKATVASGLVASVAAHGSMTHPRPRNAYSSPGTNPSRGADLSCVGDACFWYHVGCSIGCPSCKTDGGAKTGLYADPHCTKAEGLIEPTNNDPEFRTWDPQGSSECGDFTKYNPWRAPGKAPVNDPCGIASGFSGTKVGEIPQGYRLGDFGSKVLPEAPATTWKAGSTAQVGWGMSAQHGGGYSYRLCPKSQGITEACFQSNVLTFAAGNSTIHFEDSSHADIEIPTKTYVAPDGAQWRTNPIPGCACDNGISCGGKTNFLEGQNGWPSCSYPESKVYAHHGSATSNCPRGTMFEAGFDQFTQGYLVGNGNKFSVMDEVNVPNTPGEYVLAWRWDCEETDQVWNSCADIVITDGPVPPPAPPAPPAPTPPAPTPSPSPSGACASRHPSKKFDCYYEGCKTGATGTCTECCDGCVLETDPVKGSFCMEDKSTV